MTTSRLADRSAGIEQAKALLEGALLIDHLLIGFDLLFRKTLFAAVAQAGYDDPGPLLQRCALQLAEDCQRARVGTIGSAKRSEEPVVLEEAAVVLVGHFAAERDEDLLDPGVFDEINALLTRPAGLRAVINGAIRVVETAYDLWLYYGALAFAMRRGDATVPPRESDQQIAKAVAAQMKRSGLKGLAVIVDFAIESLPPPARRLRPGGGSREYGFADMSSAERAELVAESLAGFTERFRPHLRATTQMLGAIAEGIDWDGATGSGFRSEIESLNMPGAVNGLHYALQEGRLCAYAARDHARTLELVLSLAGGVLGPSVIARAALEAAARSCWLLGDDVSGGERSARSFAYRRSVAGWAKVASEVLEVDHESADDVDRLAAEAGFQFDDGGFRGQRNLSDTKVVLWLLRDQSPRVRKAAYAVLSEVAHSRPRGVRLLEVAADLSRSTTLSPAYTESVLQQSVSVVFFAVIESFDAVFRYVGADRTEWHHWKRYIRRELREEGGTRDSQ